MYYDLIVRHAQLHRYNGLVDLAIANGLFARIAPTLTEGDATREIDAAGRLLLPPLIDSHVHLDAALTVGKPRYNASGTLLEGIQIWSELKPQLHFEEIKKRALTAIGWEV